MTTAICITIAGYMLLARKGLKWAWTKINQLKKKYMPPEPQTACIAKPESKTMEIPKTDSLKEKIAEAKLAGVSLIEYLRRTAQTNQPG